MLCNYFLRYMYVFFFHVTYGMVCYVMTIMRCQQKDEHILRTIQGRYHEWTQARNDQLQARTDELAEMRHENAALRSQVVQVLRRMEDLTNQQWVDPTHSVAASDMLVEEESQAGSQSSPISNSEEKDHDSEEDDEVEEPTTLPQFKPKSRWPASNHHPDLDPGSSTLASRNRQLHIPPQVPIIT